MVRVMVRGRTSSVGFVALLMGLATATALAQRSAVEVYAGATSKLMYYQADLRRFPAQRTPDRNGQPWGTQEWTSTDQTASWDLNVVQSGDYAVSLLYLCPAGGSGSEVEVSVDGTLQKATGSLHETGNAWRKPGWELQTLNGLLRLEGGRRHILLRVVSKQGNTQEILELRSLELVEPTVRDQMEKRAKALRADTSWMVDAKYGLMTHWTPYTQPRRGLLKPYCEAVHDFDVDSYVAMVQKTGAGYLVFTTGWGGFWFPAPIHAINAAIPGRGCERDLVMKLADALAKDNIKLILYFGWNIGIEDYRKAWGSDLSQWPPQLVSFLQEIGQRYGTKLAGLFFDGGYESQVYPYQFDFETVTRAAKTGNANRVVPYNNWIFPEITPFQDYWIGESSHDLLSPPGAGAFAKDGPQQDMQAHLNTFLDDFDWCHTRPNSDMLPPWHTTEQVVDYVRTAVAEKTVPSINISIYQDGTVQDATLKQMEAVRSAIRGH